MCGGQSRFDSDVAIALPQETALKILIRTVMEVMVWAHSLSAPGSTKCPRKQRAPLSPFFSQPGGLLGGASIIEYLSYSTMKKKLLTSPLSNVPRLQR